jgi:hypothetical protein
VIWFAFFVAATIYLAVIALGLACFWLARQLASGKRLNFIKGFDDKPLPHAALIAKDFALMLCVLGAGVLLLALAVPVYGLAWSSLAPGVGVLASIFAIWRHALLLRYTRRVAEEAKR